VRIEFGPLVGLEGQVVFEKSRQRLVLSVHLLQRSVSVEIDRSWVRPLAPQ
jgi:transcription antitermination factor NusG